MHSDCDMQEEEFCDSDIKEEKSKEVESLRANIYYAPHLITQLGDLLLDRYYVECLLSDGHMSNVWLCWDLEAMRQVVIKIAREAYTNNAMICVEKDTLKELDRFGLKSPHRKRIVEMFDDFLLVTPRTSLCCLVLEAMDGTVTDLIARDNRLPLMTVKNISMQMFEGLAFLHKCHIVHTDIKPENVFFTYIDERRPVVRIKIGDFGNSFSEHRQTSVLIQTPPYRSVEVILGAGISKSSDIWSVGCMIFEMVTTKYLFDFDCTDFVKSNREHLKLITKILGPIPFHLIFKGDYSQMYFDANCRLISIDDLKPECIRDILIEVYGIPRSEAEPLAWFLEYTLQLDPRERPTAEQCLSHDWLS
ncbi:SRSF protein kinase 1-like [Drosophila albomicans]|uniref:non-specific serine/threonine protein kinase n=1 Tax=Drosophila albomicans TaxID=7291 RepID=A0A6P8YVR7_DROAB|nr:SRSF protein kinase 1-like [Drosophila albomicans]